MLRDASIYLLVLVTSLVTGVAQRSPSTESMKAEVERCIRSLPEGEDARLNHLMRLRPPFVPELIEAAARFPDRLPPGLLSKALGRIGGRAAHRHLAARVASKDVALRRAAVEGLAELGSLAIPELVGALDDADPRVHQAAFAALLSMPERRQVSIVRSCGELLDHSPRPEQVARFLGSLGSRRAVAMLRGLLRARRPDLKIAGLEGLMVLGRTEDLDRVLSLLDHREALVRKRACVFLGTVKARDAVPALIEVLEITASGARRDAHWALRRISGLKLGADPALWWAWWERKGRKTPPPASEGGDEVSEATVEGASGG